MPFRLSQAACSTVFGKNWLFEDMKRGEEDLKHCWNANAIVKVIQFTSLKNVIDIPCNIHLHFSEFKVIQAIVYKYMPNEHIEMERLRNELKTNHLKNIECKEGY